MTVSVNVNGHFTDFIKPGLSRFWLVFARGTPSVILYLAYSLRC